MSKHRQNFWEANAEFREDNPRARPIYRVIDTLSAIVIVGLLAVIIWGPK